MRSNICPMLARSDWGVGHIHQRGYTHLLSPVQSSVGFHGAKTGGWLVFLNGVHRGEDLRVPVGNSKIGANWSADLVVTGPGVGSEHAVIRMGAGEASIVPSSEHRLVRVNNNPVTGPCELQDGMLVTMGELHAVFRLAVGFEPGYRPPLHPKPLQMPSQEVPKVMTCGWLVITRGSLAGLDFRLTNGISRLGADENIEISIPDPHLAKELLSIECTYGKACKVTKVAKGRALRINGSVAEEQVVLRDSDILAVDHLEVLFKCL